MTRSARIAIIGVDIGGLTAAQALLRKDALKLYKRVCLPRADRVVLEARRPRRGQPPRIALAALERDI
jgi:hypothetical protein